MNDDYLPKCTPLTREEVDAFAKKLMETSPGLTVEYHETATGLIADWLRAHGDGDTTVTSS